MAAEETDVKITVEKSPEGEAFQACKGGTVAEKIASAIAASKCAAPRKCPLVATGPSRRRPLALLPARSCLLTWRLCACAGSWCSGGAPARECPVASWARHYWRPCAPPPANQWPVFCTLFDANSGCTPPAPPPAVRWPCPPTAAPRPAPPRPFEFPNCLRARPTWPAPPGPHTWYAGSASRWRGPLWR